MKRILILIAPFLISIIIFVGVTYFLNKSSGKGALQVTSIPQSNVYLDDKLLGKTPFCMGTEKCEIQNMIKIGEYSIRLVPIESDYKPFEEKISINKSTLTVVDRAFSSGAAGSGSIITLSPISNKKDAQILAISLPDKGNVFLDSNQVGTTPILLKNLTESDHDLQITKDGYSHKLIKISTALGYKLTSLVYLGVDPNFSSISARLQEDTENIIKEASDSGDVSIQKVVILNTPTGFLRVREEASIASSEIGRVSPGEVYELVDEKNGWFEIKINSLAGEDKSGWVSAQYAKKE